MGTRTYETTNAKLAVCLATLDQLIAWAGADAEHAAENDAHDTANDDRWRAGTLARARTLIAQCERDA